MPPVEKPLTSFFRSLFKRFYPPAPPVAAVYDRRPEDEPDISPERFHKMLLDALDDPDFARALARRLLVPTFPIQGANPDDVTTSTGGSKTGYLPYFTSNVNIEKSLVFEDVTNSRIGIGTASPGANLHVYASSGVPEIRNDLAGTLSQWQQSSLATYFGSHDNVPLILKTVNAERMRIDTSGRVGVGTAKIGRAHV